MDMRKRLIDVRETRTDIHGQYQFQGLSPGNYRILSTFEFHAPDPATMELAGPRAALGALFLFALARQLDELVLVGRLDPSPGGYPYEVPEASELPAHSELVGGEFWKGEIARHDRPRLAYAVWSVLSRRLLGDD